MPQSTVQEYVARTTQQAAEQLLAALESLPADRQNWSPFNKGRTALDQVAECALINKFTVPVLASGEWNISGGDLAAFQQARTELASDPQATVAALRESVAALVPAIRAVPDDFLDRVLQLPWGPMTLQQIMANPYWNMSYHEGQITYIGCLAE